MPSTVSAAPAPSRRWTHDRLAVAGVIAAAAALYLWRLSSTPLFVGGDETYFALHARSIALTGRDPSGRLLPLFFNIDIHTWYQPVLVYLMAPFVRLFGISEWSIRLPTALIGVLDVALMYAVGRKIFASATIAALCAFMLAASPAHVIVARQALDYICPVPFVLGWIWCVLTAIEKRDARFALAAGFLLGAGCYSYIASWIMMPVYLVITVIAFGIAERRVSRLAAAAVAGFALPLLLLALWTRAEPGAIQTMFVRYKLWDPGQQSAYRAVRELLHPYVIEERLSLYWRYFDPVFLFLTGSPDPTLSTQRAGVFLWPVAPFLVVGFAEMFRRADARLILLAGFLCAPIAPVLVDSGNAIQRELPFVAFGVLIAGFGVQRALNAGHPFEGRRSVRAWRAAAALLIAALSVQTALFARDYFGDYRLRAADRLDPVNFGALAHYVVERDASAALARVELSESLDDVYPRWRFHLAKLGRDDLWKRTWIVDKEVEHDWSVLQPLPPLPFDGGPALPNRLFVLYANDPGIERLIRYPCCEAVQTIAGANGTAASVVVQTRGAP